MAKSRKSSEPAKSVLYGDDLGELLSEVRSALGGNKGVAEVLANKLKDPNTHPYEKTRAWQSYMRLVERADGRARVEEAMADDVLEEEILRDCVRLFVEMPDEQFEPTIVLIRDKRKALAERKAKVQALKDAALRPLGSEVSIGISPSAA